MSPAKVLVIFYSRAGHTETLAMSAAVGSVQARANIRLRRLPDVVDATTLEESAECREALARMKKEYVAPAEADIVWADAIVFGTPARFNAASAEWAGCLDLLGRLQSRGALDGKVATMLVSNPAVSDNREPALMSFAATILQLGFVAVPPSFGQERTQADAVERAIQQGRRVAAIARAMKEKP
jgi:NAD(P)H dehydrogenase (quinone)